MKETEGKGRKRKETERPAARSFLFLSISFCFFPFLSSAAFAAEKAGATSHLGGVIRYGQDIEIKPGDVIDGPVIALRGSVTVEGAVDGPVVAIAGSATAEPGARVNGPLVSIGGHVQADQARIDGPVVELPSAFSVIKTILGMFIGAAGVFGGIWLAYRLFSAAGWIALALLAWLLFPDALERSKAGFEERLGPAALAGILAGPGAALISGLLVISVIGITFLPLLALAVAAAWVWGFAVLSYSIGSRLITKDKGALRVLSGALALKLLSLIPGLGWLVCLAAGILGVGAALVTRFGWAPNRHGG